MSFTVNKTGTTVCPNDLHAAIDASVIITHTLIGLIVEGTNIAVMFEDPSPLSGAEDAELVSIIASHVCSPTISDGPHRILSGNFIQQSGTPNIPHDNTTPLSTEGAQVMSQVITPRSVNSKFIIQACLPCDANTNGAHLTAAIFRGTTCIGVSSLEAASKGLIGLSNSDGTCLNVLTTDSPDTTSPITYSMRFGSSAGTWFLNRTSAATFGGVGNKGWMIMEII